MANQTSDSILHSLQLANYNTVKSWISRATNTASKASFTTINPRNEEVFATATYASLKDYEKAIYAMLTAYK